MLRVPIYLKVQKFDIIIYIFYEILINLVEMIVLGKFIILKIIKLEGAMKNLLSSLLPGFLIFTYILVDSMYPESKYILLGIYIFFPLVFILQGI